MATKDKDRSEYGGSVYDQQYFSDSELESAAAARASAEAGETTWDDAHSYVESLRSKYGYSGDSNGSSYVPASQKSTQESFSYESAPSYTSKYQSQINALTKDILNREAFSYDPEQDETYQQYKESYTRNGERAMQDTLGQVSARTGGLASSYASNASQQTYDNYMDALADKIPELQQLAYSMYQDEGDTQRTNLEMLQALDSGDYAKYQDLLAQYNADRSVDYGIFRDSISDQRYDNEWNYNVGRDAMDDRRYEDETAYSRETYEDETEYNRALQKALDLAESGNFSGYKALGYSDEEIAGKKAAYDSALAAAAASRYSSSGGRNDDEEETAPSLNLLFQNMKASGNPYTYLSAYRKDYGLDASSMDGVMEEYNTWLKASQNPGNYGTSDYKGVLEELGKVEDSSLSDASKANKWVDIIENAYQANKISYDEAQRLLSQYGL